MSIQPGDQFFRDDAQRSQNWRCHGQFPGAHGMLCNEFCSEFDKVFDTVISEAL